jgi:predicted alpha/beta hydrolase family esterase
MIHPTILVLPGWQNSGPQHWQTVWQEQNPGYLRVEQRAWDQPVLADWVGSLSEAVARAKPPVVLVAHSLGCITITHWAKLVQGRSGVVRAALLVAPADVERTDTPWQLQGFGPVPSLRLPFPSVVVASSNDPYLGLDRAQTFAENWRSQFFNIGPAGHINGESGLGDWPEGKRMLRSLTESATASQML